MKKNILSIVGSFVLSLFCFISTSNAQLQFVNPSEVKSSDARGVLDIENAPELLVILVCDNSASMEDNGKIAELNDALDMFYTGVGQDDLLSQKLKVAVVGFESSAMVVRQPSFISAGQSAPQFNAGGGTNMTEGLQVANQMLQQYGNGVLKPIVIMITDGEPNDASSAMNKAFTTQQYSFFNALGVSGSDFNFLNQLTGNQNASAQLRGTNFGAFFGDVQDDLKMCIMSNHPANPHRMGVNNTPIPFKLNNRRGWKK
ncbi:vWA domain-containing protein [Bernardetia sp.]|uniref:vWA domain-containing protein n=1 Tax=Bernardetia sp. TaxID=1937974 RepID=UPI0025C1D4C4|nr:VWA domain-containing protein [Bernardetia sp.]